jgi:SsrA-binding protein
MANDQTKKKKAAANIQIVNKHGLHDNLLLEKFEAGLILSGDEVKSVKKGSATLQDGFVHIRGGEAYLENSYIAPYQKVNDYEPRKARKLLLKKDQIDYLMGKSQASALTIIPTKMYNTRGLIKVEIALVRGKKLYDKRKELKEEAISRDVEQELRGEKLKFQQKEDR